MLACKDLTELVSEYLDRHLPFGRWLRFQVHLAGCRHCRAYLRQMKAAIRLLGRLPAEPAPRAVEQALLARFRELRPPQAAAGPARRQLLSLLDRLGRAHGGVAAGVAVFAAVLTALFRGWASQEGLELGAWQRCLGVEIGAASFVLAAVLVAASRTRQRLSVRTLAALGAGGSLLGFLVLSVSCPGARELAHALVVDAGGVALGALLGATASVLPVAHTAAPS